MYTVLVLLALVEIPETLSLFASVGIKECTIFRKLLAWHSSCFAAATDPGRSFVTSGNVDIDINGSHDVLDAFYC